MAWAISPTYSASDTWKPARRLSVVRNVAFKDANGCRLGRFISLIWPFGR